MRIAMIGNPHGMSAEMFYSQAFKTLGHSVLLLDQYGGTQWPLVARLLVTRTRIFRPALHFASNNENVSKGVEQFDPDVVIVFKGELLSAALLKELGSRNHFVLFYPDAYRYTALLRGRVSRFEMVFTHAHNHQLFSRLGARRVETIAWACDPGFHRQLSCPQVYDTSFIGSPYLIRWRIIRQLPETHVFGPYWVLKPSINHPPVFGNDFVRVINQTKVNLNIQHPLDVIARAPTWRIFEVAGCGGFLLSSEVPPLSDMLPEVVTFRSISDLKDKVAYYLKHEDERQDVGGRLRRVCIEKHTFVHRARQILACL